MEKDKGYYSLGPQRSPLPQLLAMPQPTEHGSMARVRMVCGHRIGARPVHMTRCEARQCGGAPSVMRPTAQPSTRLRLHAATPTPRWQLCKRGSHQSSEHFGNGARHPPRWAETSGLGSLAAQACHKY
jgi:hypothetical protein